MAQRDYVSRGRSGGAKRKSSGRKTRRSAPGTSKTMMVLAVAVLATFVAGLYFLMHHKPGSEGVIPTPTPHNGNALPPKPEERWRYIKELENRQVGVATPTEPKAGGEDLRNQPQLTDEQRQLLSQMQADMRRPPTQLSEVPYNDPGQNTRRQPSAPVTQQPYQAPPAQTAAPRQNTATGTQNNPVQAMQPKPAAQAQQQQKPKPAPAPAPVTNATTQQQAAAAKPQQEKSQKWLLQCGSFRSADQAESVRAQLAFEGIESRITSGGGWNRVLLGPYASRAAADKMQQRLKGVGMSSCIPLASGG